jgi:acid phosphatase type 7
VISTGAKPTGVTGTHRVFWDGRRPAPDGWSDAARLEPRDLARDGLPFVTGTVDAAYVGPAVGQLPAWELPYLLEEFRRVLRVGGRIRVAAYDLQAAVDAYTRRDADFFWDRSSAYLSGGLASQLLQLGAARSLLDADLLAELLERAGFEDVEPQPFRESRADPVLAAPDQLAGHCCYVDARNPSPWPTVEPEAGPSAVHLVLGDRRSRSIHVVWCGPAGAEGAVRYRPAGTSAWDETRATCWPTVDGASGPQVFGARCDRLEGGQGYEYEVVQVVDGRRSVVDGSSFVTPPAAESAAVRLAFVADTGISGRSDGLSDGTPRVVEEVSRVRPHVVLGGGDYAYRSSDRRWRSGPQAVHAWLEEMAPLVRNHPLMVQYGNHEVELGERYRDWSPHFPPPAGGAAAGARSYSFEVGPCHVAAFYAPTEAVDPAELSWLWQDLSAARRRGSHWLVVYQHQPLVAHGRSHPADGRVARALGHVLDRHGVDLHLSAHDQSYERTYPLTWDGSRLRSASAELDNFRRGSGTVLAKVSPAGKRSERGGSFSKLPDERAELVAVADDSAHHFAIIDADTQTLQLTTYALRDSVGPVEKIDEAVIAS